MTQSEAIGYLRRQVFEDARRAGWLRPCVRKTSGSVFYRFADVQDVALRITAGDYPSPQEADA